MDNKQYYTEELKKLNKLLQHLILTEQYEMCSKIQHLIKVITQEQKRLDNLEIDYDEVDLREW